MSFNEEFSKLRGSNPLFAGAVGGGLAVLVSKVLDLLASGYAGHGYQLEYPQKVATVVFILLIAVILFFSRPRWRDVKELAEENDRRLAELDERLDKLRDRLKR